MQANFLHDLLLGFLLVVEDDHRDLEPDDLVDLEVILEGVQVPVILRLLEMEGVLHELCYGALEVLLELVVSLALAPHPDLLFLARGELSKI